MSHRTILGVLMSVSLAAGVSAADDSAEVTAHIAAARKAAGTEWARSVDLYCATQQQLTASRLMAGPNVPNVPSPFNEPKQVFDNLYFIGQKPVLQWAITTPAGIILIDAGTQERV